MDFQKSNYIQTEIARLIKVLDEKEKETKLWNGVMCVDDITKQHHREDVHFAGIN